MKRVLANKIFASMHNEILTYHEHTDKDGTIRKILVWLKNTNNKDKNIIKQIFPNIYYSIDLLSHNITMHSLAWID